MAPRDGACEDSHRMAMPEPKIVVVMPAYNAARTLRDTHQRIPPAVREVILVDDHSQDDTVAVARQLGLKVIHHPHNVGYGGNQKTCYMEALRDGADVVVMLHPDGQYDPAIIPEMIQPIREAGRTWCSARAWPSPAARPRAACPAGNRSR